MISSNVKTERLREIQEIKREIILHMFEYLSRQKYYDVWYKYKGEFRYEGNEYTVECEVKMDNQMFTYKNLFIDQKQIIIDVHDMARRGLLN